MILGTCLGLALVLEAQGVWPTGVTYLFLHQHMAGACMIDDYLVRCQEVGALVPKPHWGQP